VVAERASLVSYLPFDRTSGYAWLIEDEAEAAVSIETPRTKAKKNDWPAIFNVSSS